MSDAAQKHKFLLAAMKMGLQHFDVGGTVKGAGEVAFPATAAIGAMADGQGQRPDASVAAPNPNPTVNTGQNMAQSFKSLPGGNTAGQYENKMGINDPLGNAVGAGTQKVINGAADVTQQTMQGAGGFAQGIAGAFTPQNSFQAQLANTHNSNYGNVIDQAAGNALNGNAQAQQATAQQQSFLDAIRAQNGVGNQQSVFNQQQAIANGQGPNPAQAMLNQSTGNNIAQQAALMAGQRGSSANAGLIARQAAMQGGNIQQQAAGQAATMQAQQSLNALNQQSGIAQNQVANQQAAQSGLQAGILGEQGLSNQLFTGAAGAQNAQNANDIANWNNAQTINAATAQNNTNAVNKTMGNMMGGASSALMALLAEGGMVKGYADGGYVPSTGRNVTTDPGDGMFKMPSLPKMPGSGDDASSSGGDASGGSLAGTGGSSSGTGASIPVVSSFAQGGMEGGEHHLVSFLRQGHKMMAKGGKVPALVSPGEVYLPPKKVEAVAKGANPIKEGEKIPGKPKHPGNDYANDTVPKKLDVGGIVIPNAVLQSKNPQKNAEKFIAAILAKQQMKAKK